MAEDDQPDQNRGRPLADRQAAGLHPIGQALRATYDADNHDTLGGDLTGLMLELTRLGEPAPPPVGPPVTIAPARPVSWFARLFGRPRS